MRKIVFLLIPLIAMATGVAPASADEHTCNQPGPNVIDTPTSISNGVAYFHGTPGDDVIRPSGWLNQNPGYDIASLDGGAGDDLLCGHVYKTNFLWGGSGQDIMYGGTNDDYLNYGNGYTGDYGVSGAGNDTFDRVSLYDTVICDVVVGNNGDNIIYYQYGTLWSISKSLPLCPDETWIAY